MKTTLRVLLLCVASLALASCATRARAPSEKGPLGFDELVSGEKRAGTVSVTWYGVATLLFDDGRTRVLVDGFFSRPDLGEPESFFDVMAEPDLEQIARMIEEAKLDGLAAITPVHSHFDHAMDVGVIARSTGAIVLGSDSTANIARGAGVPEEQIRVVDDRDTFGFGQFEISLIRSRHAPLLEGEIPLPGSIDSPLVPPVGLGEWKEGGSYSIVVEHPSGTALVQGSAGFVEGRLVEVAADLVFLGAGGLDRLGKDYADRYLAETVGATGARCVLPIHWDDFTVPFGTIVYAGAETTPAWLQEYANVEDHPIALATLPFGEPVHDLFGVCDGWMGSP